MPKQTRKSSLRLNAAPPGIPAFADGGAVRKETADELMARIAGKYGVSGQAPVASVQPPTPQPQPNPQIQPTGGLLQQTADGIRNRFKQADQVGYSGGGKITGPGTAKSDSIQATVRETGEPIKVSNGERIVSVAQGKFLEEVAKNAGYESLDAMLEDGTGKPVGPKIKAGKRAAADGLPPETDPDTDGRRQYSATMGDAFANRGGKEPVGPAAGLTISPGGDDKVKAAIDAPPTLGGTVSRTGPAGSLTGPAAGLNVSPSEIADGQARHMVENNLRSLEDKGSGIVRKVGADGRVEITNVGTSGITDPNKTVSVNSYDGRGEIQSMQRQNDLRQSMIASAAANQGVGNGLAILSDPNEAANAEKTRRWRMDDLIDKARGNPQAIAAVIQASASNENEAQRAAVATRGQDLNYATNIARQGLTARGQDINAATADDRIASNEAIAGARIAASTNRTGQLTLAQQRINAEIDAARSAVTDLTPDEIKRKTANFTATGRENPDFDPALAKAVTLANRRKVGADDEFDQRKPESQQTGNNDDVITRFRGDKAMSGYKLGKHTDRGHEVLDADGNVIGHWN